MLPESNQKFIFYAKGLEHKSFYDAKAKKKKFHVSGHVSSEDLDLVNDICTKGCMEDMSSQFKSRSIKLDFDHETIRPDGRQDDEDAKFNLTRLVLGKAISESLDSKGNKVTFDLNPSWKKFDEKGNITMNFQELWENIENGFYDAFSIAYVPVKTASKSVNGVVARLLEKVNLLNVALTGNPINPAATMTAVMAKSLQYMKDKEKGKYEGKNMTDDYKHKKLEGKAYEKDGAHAHTENEPLGNHNHPEIERILNDGIDFLHERIDRTNTIINEMRNPNPNDENSLVAGKADEEDESGDKNKKTYNKKSTGENMAEDKKDEKVAGKSDEESDNGQESNSGQEGAKEGKSTEESEVLKQVKSLTGVITDLKSEIDTMKAENAEMKEILGKARPAGNGAANKADAAADAAKEAAIQGKSEQIKGTLDLI